MVLVLVVVEGGGSKDKYEQQHTTFRPHCVWPSFRKTVLLEPWS